MSEQTRRERRWQHETAQMDSGDVRTLADRMAPKAPVYLVARPMFALPTDVVHLKDGMPLKVELDGHNSYFDGRVRIDSFQRTYEGDGTKVGIINIQIRGTEHEL